MKELAKGQFFEKQLDALTTDEMFEGQRFAILAIFFNGFSDASLATIPVIPRYPVY